MIKSAVISGVLIIILCPATQAHRPIFSEKAATGADTAVPISQPDISQVIYREITEEAGQVWLAFDASEGFELFVQIGVPALDRLKDFRPAVSMVGPGLAATNTSFALPEGAGVKNFPTEDIEEPRFFHEHFTGTDSWILRSETVVVPESGRYYVVAHVPPGEEGKLWLSVGRKEVFGVGDLLRFPEWRRKIRKFHEVREDGDVEIHRVESVYQNGEQEIRVLLPDDYREDKYYRVLHVLPVEKGFEERYGYGLGVLQQMGAHNKYDVIIVQAGFEREPWYGDHASDPKTRQASYLKEFVVPFIEGRYSTMRIPEGRLLLGFSKSGWGAFSLIMMYPEFFGYAASWDAPMFFDRFRISMEPVYGTLEQLNVYRPDLLAVKQRRHFRLKPRLVLTGERGWGTSIPAPGGGSHTAEMHRLLEEEGIEHIYDNSLMVPHRWSEQWMEPVLEALMGIVRDPLASHEKAVARAEELKGQIELAPKPWGSYRCVMKGQIDLCGDGRKSHIEVTADGLSFWSGRFLRVQTPGKDEEIRLDIYWDGQDMYDPAHLGWSRNADDPLYAPEREFLEKVKYGYDYVPEEVILAQSDDPNHAVHFWGKDNGKIEEGRLNIRRYKGRPRFGLSDRKPRLEDGPMVFGRSGRGSLFAYDREANEHFLLFHCDNKYNSPSVLAKYGSWLLIGLWGEGLAAVDLEDYYLKRFSSIKETIGKIEVTESEIVLDDGRHRVPLPIEKSGERTREFYFGPRGAK